MPPLSVSSFNHLRNHPRHITPNPCIIKQTLDLPDGRDGDIPIPQLPLRKVLHITGRDGADDALDLLGAQAAAGGDDLATDVLGHGGGAVEAEEQRGLELGLGALDFGVVDGEGEAGPFAEGEVDEIVNAGDVV